MSEIISVRQASRELDVTPGRVRQFIYAKQLPATKLGREWAIRREDLEAFRQLDRPHGRPPKRSD